MTERKTRQEMDGELYDQGTAMVTQTRGGDRWDSKQRKSAGQGPKILRAGNKEKNLQKKE